MSEPLEQVKSVIMGTVMNGDEEVGKFVTSKGGHQIVDALNAAIDRINQLSAENKELRSLWSESEDREVAFKVRLNEQQQALDNLDAHNLELNKRIAELEAKYEEHYHDVFVEPLGYFDTDGPVDPKLPDNGENDA